jgi:hypothetical protein
MRYWLGLAVAIAVGLSVASAQAQTPSPTATPTPTVAATNTPAAAATATPVATAPTIEAIASPPSTGDFVLDRALSAIAGTNPDDVSRQLHFLTYPCTPIQGLSGIPCPEGKPVGTYVSGMWVLYCEGRFIPAGTPGIADAVRAFISSRQSLWAVTEKFLPIGAQFEAFYLPGSVALIDGQGIVGFQYPCGTTNIGEAITAVVGASPQYILAPGNPPSAPATGTGPVPAEREDLRLWIAAIFAMGAASVVFVAAFSRHGRRRPEH